MVKSIESLYKKCVRETVCHWTTCILADVSDGLLVDLVEECIASSNTLVLHRLLYNTQAFTRLVSSKDEVTVLYRGMQLLINHDIPLHMQLTDLFIHQGERMCRRKMIKVCEFFLECGWYTETGKLLAFLVKTMDFQLERYNVLTALTLLISTNIADCHFSRAKDAFVRATKFYDSDKDVEFNCALMYAEESYRHYCLSNFTEAKYWSHRALLEINETVDVSSCITVLRRTSKVYINTRHFDSAYALIKHAVGLARLYYGTNHPLYAEVLQDYGFCLLHLDKIKQCVQVYEEAVRITDNIFGEHNIKSAIAHEDLAYAAYVHDYSEGDYLVPLKHSEISLRIVCKLLEPTHLLHASTSRLRALILEEIAFDTPNQGTKDGLLNEAQELHRKSLKLCRNVLGEVNIQTAKHYGNLGRLFQSMKMFRSAEKMHKRAIKIKERLLGTDNYELALSLGHLASLYNYDMCRYQEALPLYKYSISITTALFGNSFSGLEYDYRGLMHLYQSIGKQEEYYRYVLLLHDWTCLRADQSHELDHSDKTSVQSTRDVIKAVIDIHNS